MKLDPDILRNVYSLLYCCDPFIRWNLPLPEEINFVVDFDTQTMGTYLYDTDETHEHTITISAACCRSLGLFVVVLPAFARSSHAR